MTDRPSRDVVLRLTGITKRFGQLTANDDISFALHKGEVLALLGENGAGKTTLMNILFGHYTADAGTVEVDEFMTLESYAHVHHIVSNVEGRIRPGVLPGEIIGAVFPGGTITGCPKVRCMQIISERRSTMECHIAREGLIVEL